MTPTHECEPLVAYDSILLPMSKSVNGSQKDFFSDDGSTHRPMLEESSLVHQKRWFRREWWWGATRGGCVRRGLQTMRITAVAAHSQSHARPQILLLPMPRCEMSELSGRRENNISAAKMLEFCWCTHPYIRGSTPWLCMCELVRTFLQPDTPMAPHINVLRIYFL